jgi:6-pyruvoyl tetrahydropterin synthase/QueD family protein
VEVTGSAFERWREEFKAKVKRIRKSWKSLPIVVVTYVKSVSYLRELTSIPFVRLYGMGKGSQPEEKTLIVESDHFNFDYTHFLPWHTGKCADFHGHSSTISVAVKGIVDSKGMVVDFSEVKRVVKSTIDLIDHKIFVPRYCLKRVTKKRIWISFVSKKRLHKMEIPRSEVVVLDKDSTIENISAMIAAQVLDSLPPNVTEVTARVNEGIGKAAASTACAVSRDFRGVYTVEDRPADFLRAISFYKLAPMQASPERARKLVGQIEGLNEKRWWEK